MLENVINDAEQFNLNVCTSMQKCNIIAILLSHEKCPSDIKDTERMKKLVVYQTRDETFHNSISCGICCAGRYLFQ